MAPPIVDKLSGAGHPVQRWQTKGNSAMNMHFTPATDVTAARRPDPAPVFKAPHAPVSDDYRIARVCAASQLVQAGFDAWEARAIAAHACAGAAVAGDRDIFSGIMARAWASARGERALPSHPGGAKSDAWLTTEARPAFVGKGYAEARSV